MSNVVGRVTGPLVILVIFESLFVAWLLGNHYSVASAISIPLITLAGVVLLVAMPTAVRVAAPAAIKNARKKIHEATSNPDDKDTA